MLLLGENNILLSYRLHLLILFLLLLRIRASQSTLNERGVIVGLWVGSGGEWTKPQTLMAKIAFLSDRQHLLPSFLRLLNHVGVRQSTLKRHAAGHVHCRVGG